MYVGARPIYLPPDWTALIVTSELKGEQHNFVEKLLMGRGGGAGPKAKRDEEGWARGSRVVEGVYSRGN